MYNNIADCVPCIPYHKHCWRFRINHSVSIIVSIFCVNDDLLQSYLSRIVNFPSRGKLKQYEVRYAIKRAFEIWSNVTALEFRELDRSSESDIRIEFLRGSHSRDKDHPMFDGPDGELAHAFAPNSGWGDVDGDVHFDDAEIFNIEDSENGKNTLSKILGSLSALRHGMRVMLV